MSSELTTMNPEILASLIINGDVAKLNPAQRVEYITKLCERVGIDPLTQPFKILRLNGREVLYADKGCTQQLCKVYGISTEVTKKEKIEDVYIVTVRASNKEGRFTDEDGAVTIGNLKGDGLANALMKAVTKSKRRAVLAFCGLGMLDETEIETIPNAVPVENMLKMPTSKPKEVESTPQIAVISPTIALKATKKQEASIPASEATEVQDLVNTTQISNEDGKKLMAMIKANGYTKQDLAEFVMFQFNIDKLQNITYGHLTKINEYFGKAKS